MNKNTKYIIAKATACIRTAFRVELEIYSRIPREIEEWIKMCADAMIKECGYDEIEKFLNTEITFFKDGEFYKYTSDWIGDNIMNCPGCGCKCLRYGGMCSDCAETSSVGGSDYE